MHYTIGEYVNGQIVESSDPFNTGTEYNVQDRCLLDNDLCDENTLFGCSSEEASSLSVCDEENLDNCCSYIELNDNPGFSAAPLLLKIIAGTHPDSYAVKIHQRDICMNLDFALNG